MTADADVVWSPGAGGLRIGLGPPPEETRRAGHWRFRLHLQNVGSGPLRVYFLRSERFRGFQSALVPEDPATGVPLLPPRPSPAHGLVVREEDLPLLPPGGLLSSSQSLDVEGLDRDRAGGVRVVWTYRNEVTRWPGGVPTLDGPTRELFGGGPIPRLWTGRLEVAVTVLPPPA